jgi:isoleucyl-tRNA synthetase
LYCDAKDSTKRQSTILLLKITLNALLKWFAPILSFTTEEIFKLVGNKKSIHLERFINFPINFKNDNLNLKWLELIKIRDICNLSIEEKRSAKIIGSSLEALLKIKLDKEKFEIVKDIDLSELCITSSAHVEKTERNQVLVETEKAKGDKCSVCWKISLQPCERHGA